MSEWVRNGLDIVLILLIGGGLVQATRLIWHLAGLKQGRADMERFVHDFNAAVVRAELGIKNLKQAARSTGDDLEKLVEKAAAVRDELTFIVESGDQLAGRLAAAATSVVRSEPPSESKATAPIVPVEGSPSAVTPFTARKPEGPQPSSRAEKELLQALQKLK